MKYLKIFAIALGIATLSACSSSEEKPDYNTASGVTVSMLDDEINFLESRGIVKVPFEVTGEKNGMITVSCEVKEYGSSPAMDDVHYFVTTKTVNVYPEDNEGYFEIRLVDDYDLNDDRTFTVTLIDPVGCQIGGKTTTLVNLEDNDNDPYARLGGLWYMHYKKNDAPATLPVRFTDALPGELGYNSFYRVTGLFTDPNDDETPVEIKATFVYDEEKEDGSIIFEYGQLLPDLDYDPYGRGSGIFGNTSGSSSGSAMFTWNEDASQLTFVGAGSASFYYLLKFSVGTMFYDGYDGVTYFSRDMND